MSLITLNAFEVTLNDSRGEPCVVAHLSDRRSVSDLMNTLKWSGKTSESMLIYIARRRHEEKQL